ncbi:hypothetical protein FQN54_005451 [Arachnomyces sp. PD_36]|nr:hypothetical protein FQN54_005451 [Arachnomyces sp. PD_36]
MKFISSLDDLQLDIVGFLAILGEGSVLSTANVQTLSRFTYFPRLIPAPQALIRPARPTRLTTTEGAVVGIYSGNTTDHINHVAQLLHRGDSLARHTVQWVRIVRRSADQQPSVNANLWGPLTYASLLGSALSAVLLSLSIYYDDGNALLATIFLSLVSTLVGFGSKWTLALAARKANRETPPGDVVVQYPRGVFLVVTCDEDVARALYFSPETCDYNLKKFWYRTLSLLATIFLMFGMIMLANAKPILQIFYAAAYMILNAAYWVVAALPDTWNWDLSNYEVVRQDYNMPASMDEEAPTDDRGPNVVPAIRSTKLDPPLSAKERDTARSFTGALWRAIALSGTSEWVRTAGIAPKTKAWDEWLKEAENVAMRQSLPLTPSPDPKNPAFKGVPPTLPRWDYEGTLTALISGRDPASQA